MATFIVHTLAPDQHLTLRQFGKKHAFTNNNIPEPHSVFLTRDGNGYCHQSVGTGSVKVQGSNNGIDFLDVVELTNNDAANIMHFWRFLKVTTTGDIQYHLVRGF